MAMTLNEHQVLAQRTCNTESVIAKLVNGVLGLCGETGECSDLLKKHLYQGHTLDTPRMAKELGDVLWYVAEVATGLGMTLEEIAAMNIEKLKARYPDGFDAERSLHRQEGDV
jgi:NTP pyrophosphatase (non-canonical NTP hydrolase)